MVRCGRQVIAAYRSSASPSAPSRACRRVQPLPEQGTNASSSVRKPAFASSARATYGRSGSPAATCTRSSARTTPHTGSTALPTIPSKSFATGPGPVRPDSVAGPAGVLFSHHLLRWDLRRSQGRSDGAGDLGLPDQYDAERGQPRRERLPVASGRRHHAEPARYLVVQLYQHAGIEQQPKQPLDLRRRQVGQLVEQVLTRPRPAQHRQDSITDNPRDTTFQP